MERLGVDDRVEGLKGFFIFSLEEDEVLKKVGRVWEIKVEVRLFWV